MAWARRRPRVRLHLDNETTLEGFLVARREGHYHLAMGELIEAPGRTHDGLGDVMVPRERVVFYQRLSA
jgi:hypothetical protein